MQGHFHLLLLTLVLSLATNPRTQRPMPLRTQRPMAPRAQAQSHSYHPATVVDAPEADSNVPAELARDPLPLLREGMASGTGPIPAHLKANPYRLSFWGGDYAPPSSEKIDPELLRLRQPGRTHTYGFVMIEGRITRARMDRVERLGVRLGEFHTFQSFKAKIPYAVLPRLAASDDVRWVGYARRPQKIDPQILTVPPGREVELFVGVFDSDMTTNATRVKIGLGHVNDPGGQATGTLQADHDAYTTLPNGPFQRAIEALGGKVRSYNDELRHFVVRARAAIVPALVAHDFVHFVELVGQTRTGHDQSTRQIGIDLVRGNIASDGSSTICGILDSGVHVRGSVNPTGHFDLAKWSTGWDFFSNPSGYFNDSRGHGTHVAGTFFGTGAAIARYRGCAPAAGGTSTTRLFVGKCIPGPFSLAENAITRFRSSSAGTARPHVVNNSWGGPPTSLGYYGTDSTSRAVDHSSYSYGQLYVFAAGNSGGDTNLPARGYGIDAWRSIGRPAVAKNALTVANQADRPITDQYLFNTNSSSPNPQPHPNGYDWAYLVERPSTSHSLRVYGFTINTWCNTPTTIQTSLWLADSRTGAPTTRVRTGTMQVGASRGLCTTVFSSPYEVPAGRSFLLGYASSNTMRESNAAPAAPFGKRFQRTRNGPWRSYSERLRYAVLCRVETGETIGSSSLGPTRDGRLKPNIAAPGTLIMSCKTKTTNGYEELTGTSMASPHVAGALADRLDHPRHRGDRYYPAAAKAGACATANPLGYDLTFTQSSRACYYRQGLGQIDAYKAVNDKNDLSGWVTGNSRQTLTINSAGAYFDVIVPRDADRLMFCLNFDEQEASLGATRACLADMDLYLDVEPFRSGFNTGEFSSRRAWDTWDWIAITGQNVQLFAGKKVRVKIYPRVRPTSGLSARCAVAYCFHRASPTPSQALSLTAPSYVKPNASFTLSATTAASVTAGTNVSLEISSLPGFTVRAMSYRTVDNTIVSLSGSQLSRTMGYIGSWMDPLHRTVKWTVRKATEGSSSICVTRRSDNAVAGWNTDLLTRCRTVCVDGTAPDAPTNLRSLSHSTSSWSRNRTIRFAWTRGSDRGCAGVQQQRYLLRQGSCGTPVTALSSSASSLNLSNLAESSSGHYFSIRTEDRAGNASTSSCVGPFRIDATPPSLGSVQVNSGATYTRSPLVSVRLTASDVRSGVNEMQLSLNGTAWSAWRRYTTSPQTVDLRDASLGGSSQPGTRRVYGRVRDRAGNVSAAASDSIVWDGVPPVVTSVLINSGASCTDRLTVSVTAPATGGATHQRYSLDGTTWSPWLAYTPSARSVDLANAAWGGSSARGNRIVHVQARDAAQNVSTTRSDTISYFGQPTLTAANPSTVEAVQHTAIRLAGTGLADVNRIRFGSVTLNSSAADDWVTGYFQVLSDTAIDLFTPQGLTPGAFPVRVENPCYQSGTTTVTIRHNTTRTLGCPNQRKVGDGMDILVHRGAMPPATINLLTWSSSPLPLHLPGLIRLGHGGHPTLIIDPSYFVLSIPVPHDPVTRVARWRLPTVARLTVYFASVMLDPANLVTPLPTSPVDRCRIY